MTVQSEAGDEKKSWLKPRQRILQREGRRLSLKLEQEFWDLLALSARDQGEKTTDLVFQLVANHPAENKSSLLRTYCAHWVRQKLARAELASNSADIQGILSSCPIPCVLINQEKKLLAQNGAFGEKILGSLMVPDQWDEANKVVRFSLGRPVPHIVRDLEAGTLPFVETFVAFSRGSAIVQMVGRFCLLNMQPTEGSPLLCYLYPRNKT